MDLYLKARPLAAMLALFIVGGLVGVAIDAGWVDPPVVSADYSSAVAVLLWVASAGGAIVLVSLIWRPLLRVERGTLLISRTIGWKAKDAEQVARVSVVKDGLLGRGVRIDWRSGSHNVFVVSRRDGSSLEQIGEEMARMLGC